MMKYIYSILATLLIVSQITAQSPLKMSYQSVIRDPENELVVNRNVRIRISILQTSPSGIIVYSEFHTPTTNDNGLATIEIGGGTVIGGSMGSIDWASGPYFIRTETDPEGGT